MMLTPEPDQFPVDTITEDLKTALTTHGCCVLKAETGAGKSTRIPLWLLNAPWLAGRKIIMLEPRRLAASMVAERMADTLNEPVGQTVGYRMRLNTRVSAKTRIEVVTEGILTRMLQHDPELAEAGLIIFDEFHERSIHADLGLGLCNEVRTGLRDDLRILVMSATIDSGPVAKFLGNAPEINCHGRHFPVSISYLDYAVQSPVEQLSADAILRAIEENPQGDILAFLPGEGEIMRCKSRLEGKSLMSGVDCHTLFGRMPHQDQQRAVRPSPNGKRKVVLATTIAESSLTIEGVRIVVDSGKARASRFSAKTGMNGLVTLSVSQASADQRAGRAGRTAPGVCYRLWTAPHHSRLPRFNDPEIRDIDLTPVVLELAKWGIPDAAGFTWLTPPSRQSWNQAVELLKRLQAVDETGRITDRGKAIAELPVHPRLGAMLVGAGDSPHKALACDIAALLSDRDILLTRDHGSVVDLIVRLDIMHGKKVPGMRVNTKTLSFCQNIAADLKRRLSCPKRTADADQAGGLLARAFPDRVAQKRPGSPNRYLLSNGRGATLDKSDLLTKHDFLVTATLDDRDKEALIRLAAPVSRHDIDRQFQPLLRTYDCVSWDSTHSRVSAFRRTTLDAITISDYRLKAPADELVIASMIQGIREMGLPCLPWTDDAKHFRSRLAFLHYKDPDNWPASSDDALLENLEIWLGPRLAGITNADSLKKVNLLHALQSWLDWNKRQEMDRLAPEAIKVPSGSHARIDYSDPAQPALPVRIQKLFGSTTTPTIYNNTITLRLHLLSPARKPVQITDNLERFWTSSYDLVRKELRGRYPKHYWPDDPANAQATNTTKRNM